MLYVLTCCFSSYTLGRLRKEAFLFPEKGGVTEVSWFVSSVVPVAVTVARGKPPDCRSKRCMAHSFCIRVLTKIVRKECQMVTDILRFVLWGYWSPNFSIRRSSQVRGGGVSARYPRCEVFNALRVSLMEAQRLGMPDVVAGIKRAIEAHVNSCSGCKP